MATVKVTRVQGMSGGAVATAPALSPPTETVETAFIEAEPVPLTDLQIQAMANVATTMAPTIEPPSAEEIKGVSATVWVTAKKVAALWVINQNRNFWASFQDAGWRKFSDASDSAIMAFTALASHARQVQANTDRREESDGKVHEMYVW